jgi:hypothetical protein
MDIQRPEGHWGGSRREQRSRGGAFIWHSQVSFRDFDSIHSNFIMIKCIAQYLRALVNEAA